jgi:hypothetical protein
MKNKKGIALAVVIMVFAVVAIIGTTVLTISLGEIRSSEATEHTTKAYYLARSAVEIVSTKIDNKYTALEAAQALVDSYDGKILTEAQQTDLNNAVIAYNGLLTAFTSQVVPNSMTSPKTVYVDGIQGNNLPVMISLLDDAGTLEVSCTVTYEGNTSSARAKIGEFQQMGASVNYTVSTQANIGQLGDHALFSWADLYLSNGSNITVEDGDPTDSYGGGIAAQDEARSDATQYTGPTLQSYATLDMLLIAPPAALLTTTKDAGTLAAKTTLTAADNGYYGNFYTVDKHGHITGYSPTWTVDTTAGDVILVFDAFYTESGTTINVIGSNNFYIFVRENYNIGSGLSGVTNRTLINIAGNTSITTDINSYPSPKSNPTPPDQSDISPQTYFIVYNDLVQWKSQTLGGVAVIPAIEALSLPPAYFDTVNIANNADTSAFFYAPGCSVICSNNKDLFGSIYGSDLQMKNNTTIIYWPFTYGDLFPGSDDPTTLTTTIDKHTDYNYYGDSVYSRVWIR